MGHRSEPGGEAREGVSCEGIPHNLHFFLVEKTARGQDMAEYALLIALIAIVVIIAVITLGNQLSTFFTELVTMFESL